jgi:hypothetical protein
MLQKLEKKSFDLIFINQESVEYSYEEFQVVIPLLVRYLHLKRGVVVMNGIMPAERPIESDTWKFLIYLKAFANIDSALGSFDNGVLVFRVRENLFQIHNETTEIGAIIDLSNTHSHVFHDYVSPYDHFYQVADTFVPVLDFYHMHKWLSDQEEALTVYYTSIYMRKSCVDLSSKESVDAMNKGEGDRPFILC